MVFKDGGIHKTCPLSADQAVSSLCLLDDDKEGKKGAEFLRLKSYRSFQLFKHKAKSDKLNLMCSV